MPSKTFRFPSPQGHELAARPDLPAGEPRAYALFAHCFTCSKDSKAAAFISQSLATRGIAVMRFDFTGLGASAGDFTDSTFTPNIDEPLAAAGYLRAQYQAPQLLIGHSLGGAAVLPPRMPSPKRAPSRQSVRRTTEAHRAAAGGWQRANPRGR